MEFDFFIGRYNYWIVIILMMTGLYIVVSRGNLVKKIVGLNIFQTSVFLLYITIGKVANGTAPILVGGHGDDHGGGHGDEHHGEAGAEHAAEAFDNSKKIANTLADKAEQHLAGGSAAADHGVSESGSLHAAPETAPEPGVELQGAGEEVASHASAAADIAKKGGNEFAGAMNETLKNIRPEDVLAGADPHHAAEAADHGADAAHHAGAAVDVIYSNPLPHVLILTAIVVGVATTAVGLALAVRIREAYGTIEEDEIQAADDDAEFGRAPSGPAAAEGAGA